MTSVNQVLSTNGKLSAFGYTLHSASLYHDCCYTTFNSNEVSCENFTIVTNITTEVLSEQGLMLQLKCY